MGEVLTAEYLRNIVYDLARPDQQIRQILGSYYLGCSEHFIVSLYETFDIVRNIAKNMQKSAAEVHYILWSYCTKGFGEICTAKKPKCPYALQKGSVTSGKRQSGKTRTS